MSFTANIDEVVAENRNRLLGKRPEWKRVRLKEVATILNGYPFESVRFKREAGTPLIRIRDIVPGKTETFYVGDFDPAFLVENGEILVGMDGDFHCQPWTGERALLNQRVCKITPDETRYTRQFLRYVLPGYLHAINEQTPSVTVKHLSSRTIADIPLPLPPLDEQRRIVSEIEKQFTRSEAGVAALRRVLANLKRYRGAVLKAACEGRLFGVSTAAWETRRLSELIAEDRAIGYGVLKPGPHIPTGVRLLKSGQVRDGRLDLSEDFRISPELDQEFRRTRLQGGEVLLNLVGASIGRSAIAPSELRGANVSRAIAVIPVKEHLAKWVQLVLSSPASQSQIMGHRVGNAQPVLNLAHVRRLPIPIPPTTTLARTVTEVERRLTVVDELGLTLAASLPRIARLRRSILQKAFAGDLGSQDPNDEPADALLQRIKNEPLRTPKLHSVPKRKRPMSMPTESIESLNHLLERLDKLGGSAAPDRLLLATGLGEDVERFFDLLREGRNSGQLTVPTGKSGPIRRKHNAH